MSFSAQWFSKSDPNDKIDKNDNNKKSGISVNSVNIVRGVENLKNQWGEHTHLVEWFTENVHRLPTKPYKLCEGDGWSIHYMTPAATYRKILEAIEQGPEGEHAKDRTLFGVLSDLYAKFIGGQHG